MYVYVYRLRVRARSRHSIIPLVTVDENVLTKEEERGGRLCRRETKNDPFRGARGLFCPLLLFLEGVRKDGARLRRNRTRIRAHGNRGGEVGSSGAEKEGNGGVVGRGRGERREAQKSNYQSRGTGVVLLVFTKKMSGR